MNISVLGDGAWGSAIANLFAQNLHKVTLWGPFPDYMEEMEKAKKNPRFLPQITFDDSIKFTPDIKTASADADLLVLALPSQYQRKLLTDLRPYFNNSKTIIINIGKGIENDSLERLSQVTHDILGDCKYVVLSGPSHAEEVSKGTPTAVVAGCECRETGELIQSLMMNKFFRVYYTDDYIGVELGGALKNVFAIAAGIADGMSLGDNSKAALVTRSIAEMSRFGKLLGGKYETFSGLSGIGDMLVTCYSKHSRNRFVGERLGQGAKMPEILKELGMKVAEGIKTTKSAYELAKKLNVETPVIDELYRAIYENKNPSEILKDLMERSAKPEIY
ncbi:MAG TPA: glycerol-3-phosphate dehydrogenase [Lentisphaeria bacterium]|nr:MAG: glycerol-3-phosphate dehydrogenase [Lentisphaerae bacterium GWF2_38_69]HBM15916.1 glycerol-3-phosphate dehydrogenase [Lentisphaeria bacterium]